MPLRDEIQWAACGRALLAVSPIVAAAFISGDPMWLKVGLVCISSHIAAERTHLMPLGVLLHGAAILLGFSVLFYSLLLPWLFILCCGVFGALTIVLMAKGAKLRSIGNFTFIPSLYLACETAEGLPAAGFTHALVTLLPYMSAAVVPVLIMSAIGAGSRRDVLRLAGAGEGDPLLHFSEMMWTVAIGVGLSAATVVGLALQHGQWAIWSAASVVTGDVDKSRLKVRHRFTGAFVGVPLGVLVSFWLPHNPYTYGLTALGLMLTLVTFTRYVAAFTARCMLVALSLMLAGGTVGIAAERVVNVLVGGSIGLAAVLAVHLVYGRLRRT